MFAIKLSGKWHLKWRLEDDRDIVGFPRTETPQEVREIHDASECEGLNMCAKCARYAVRHHYLNVELLNMVHVEMRRAVAEVTAAAGQLIDNRGFGVELELTSPLCADSVASALTDAGIETHDEPYNHERRTYWKIVPDGSLRGRSMYAFELVSPVLHGEDGLRTVEAVCNKLIELNVTVNVSCGLHVHHDGRGITYPMMWDIAMLYGNFEHVFDSLQPASRRGHAKPILHTNDVAVLQPEPLSPTVENDALGARRCRDDTVLQSELPELLETRFNRVPASCGNCESDQGD
jgi:hypothetical protein